MTKKFKGKFIKQIMIYGVILLVSSLISELVTQLWPGFPMPPALIGMILLYLLLTLKIVKLEQVEGVSNFFVQIISLIFIPSGIALVTKLDILKNEGLQIVIVVVISTLMLLLFTAGIAWVLVQVKEWIQNRRASRQVEMDLEED
ncbi:CidA/LrgA family protein [Lactiplantibacillus mudanjiangensis]|uniref:Effector of murein hydrolase LrgA [Lactobacillus sp.] n=1 Tax=Lactiplantibacillus mudanjiangensis TaxID=1296538 RepID=A0A660DVY5_9LACO|nr:CidA/LrgA family protein [Lactiplantibacillus mudanjiangensis]VDG20343.1 effector of murein hydrolase LrgA [Lactobacillus sp.] [Lactiplantibacillus mudanjiangensis]VDG23965.1 effector of murein hydrolase LrgA [Lactobacillus sp.] [Lactiplantibacillus mudanjiangensis]VDG27147.1 effector of murein hydrolase LrgA [Lactobacillus sp.] [Lactiplantibacillus mudanjiangensis]VDG33949.1 effector of murein hydrolase LrgA [Lactobacillus sp.] [Lactiplantibacillus mudanjiangensis]